MKTFVRKAKYDSTKHLVAMLAQNDSILKDLYAKNHFNTDVNHLYTLGFDFSIARNISDKSRPSITIFDCGNFYLEIENQNRNITIKKHEQ
jgi:hypothetical protein